MAVVQTTTETIGTNIRTTFNFDLDALAARVPRLGLHRGTALSGFLTCNKFIISASQLECDLWLPTPMSQLVGDKLGEMDKSRGKIQGVIGELSREVSSQMFDG